MSLELFLKFAESDMARMFFNLTKVVVISRVYTGTHVAGYKLYPLVAVNMFLVSATKLLPVCRMSVAGYKGIDRLWRK